MLNVYNFAGGKASTMLGQSTLGNAVSKPFVEMGGGGANSAFLDCGTAIENGGKIAEDADCFMGCAGM